MELAFDLRGPDLDAAIAAVGDMPLPPYIAGKRAVEDADRADYQTVYAAHDGAVAAPTAGLHFTPELLAALDARGISRHFVTLHVGAGTFLPVKADDTPTTRCTPSGARFPPRPRRRSTTCARAGGRIVAVGTTSLRLLETRRARRRDRSPSAGETDIFITPGYRVPRRRHPDDQLPPAALDAVHAGVGLRRPRAHAGAPTRTPLRAATASTPTATPPCCFQRRQP